VSPASQEEAIIPNSYTERVYDIKYYTRDVRRSKEPVMHLETMEKEVFDFSSGVPSELMSQEACPPGQRAPLQNASLPGGTARIVNYYDDPNNGYT